MDTLKELIFDFLDRKNHGISLSGETWTSGYNMMFYGLNDDLSDDIEITYNIEAREFEVVEYGELECEMDMFTVEDDLKRLTELFHKDLPYSIDFYLNNEE